MKPDPDYQSSQLASRRQSGAWRWSSLGVELIAGYGLASACFGSAFRAAWRGARRLALRAGSTAVRFPKDSLRAEADFNLVAGVVGCAELARHLNRILDTIGVRLEGCQHVTLVLRQDYLVFHFTAAASPGKPPDRLYPGVREFTA